MKTSRRDLLRGAALTGAVASAGALAACERKESGAAPSSEALADDAITTRTIAEAEKLQGISYTPPERAMMLEALEENLQKLAALRAVKMPNTLAPACVFNPRLPGRSYGSQKNQLHNLAKHTLPLPDEDADIAFASAGQLGAWLRAGALTATRLTEIYLSRIAHHDSALECYITVTPERARAEAAKVDKDFAKGRAA